MAKTKTTKATKKTSKPKTSAKTPTKTVKKKATTVKKAKAKKAKTPDDEVTIDRRRTGRRKPKIEAKASPLDETLNEDSVLDDMEADDSGFDDSDAPVERRAKVQRRRQIDPTTCERDYTNDEIEFMHALDEYKRASGRMFPTCSEVLEVVRNLGYVKVDLASLEANSDSPESNEIGENASPEAQPLNAGVSVADGDSNEFQPESNQAATQFGIEYSVNALESDDAATNEFESTHA